MGGGLSGAGLSGLVGPLPPAHNQHPSQQKKSAAALTQTNAASTRGAQQRQPAPARLRHLAVVLPRLRDEQHHGLRQLPPVARQQLQHGVQRAGIGGGGGHDGLQAGQLAGGEALLLGGVWVLGWVVGWRWGFGEWVVGGFTGFGGVWVVGCWLWRVGLGKRAAGGGGGRRCTANSERGARGARTRPAQAITPSRARIQLALPRSVLISPARGRRVGFYGFWRVL